MYHIRSSIHLPWNNSMNSGAQTYHCWVDFHIITRVSIKMIVFFDIAVRSLVETDRHFRDSYHICHHGRKHLWNMSQFLLYSMAQHPRRQSSSFLSWVSSVCTVQFNVFAFAGCGLQLRLLSTQSEAAATPETESDYHTIIKDTEKGTGELVLWYFNVRWLLYLLTFAVHF
jgi:hypothetical protein